MSSSTKNVYVNIIDLLDDLMLVRKLKGKDLKDTAERVANFLKPYEWCTDDVQDGLCQLYQDIKANNHRLSLVSTEKRAGRPQDVEKIKEAVRMYKNKVRPVRKILEATGIGRSTLYDNIKKYYDEV